MLILVDWIFRSQLTSDFHLVSTPVSLFFLLFVNFSLSPFEKREFVIFSFFRLCSFSLARLHYLHLVSVLVVVAAAWLTDWHKLESSVDSTHEGKESSKNQFVHPEENDADWSGRENIVFNCPWIRVDWIDQWSKKLVLFLVRYLSKNNGEWIENRTSLFFILRWSHQIISPSRLEKRWADRSSIDMFDSRAPNEPFFQSVGVSGADHLQSVCVCVQGYINLLKIDDEKKSDEWQKVNGWMTVGLWCCHSEKLIKRREKRRENVSFFLFLWQREREKQKLSFSLSPSLCLSTRNKSTWFRSLFLSLSSPSLHWLNLFFEQIKKNSLGESRRSTVVPKRTSVFDTQRCSSSSLILEWSDDPSVKANRSDHLNISYFLFIHPSSMPSECCPLFLIFY